LRRARVLRPINRYRTGVAFAAATETLKDRLAAGHGDAARAFFIVPVSLVVLFGGFIVAAIANVGRPEAHKRLILLATISIIPPAIAVRRLPTGRIPHSARVD
jgi:hypothetical protein